MLQVRLPPNFKAVRFDGAAHTALFRRLEADVAAVRFDAPEGKIELPVKLKVHDSVFAPLAKWAMLLAGNYRCVQKDTVRPIKDAVHGDAAASRAVCELVVAQCVSLGARREDLVPFEKYANATLLPGSPSSAARASPAPRTSSGWIAWCRRSRRRRGCGSPRSTRPSRSSTAGWSATAGRLEAGAAPGRRTSTPRPLHEPERIEGAKLREVLAPDDRLHAPCVLPPSRPREPARLLCPMLRVVAIQAPP